MPNIENNNDSINNLRIWVEGQIALINQRITSDEDKNKTSHDQINDKFKDVDDELSTKVSMEEFKPVRLMVYSVVSTIVMTVILAIVQGVLVK